VHSDTSKCWRGDRRGEGQGISVDCDHVRSASGAVSKAGKAAGLLTPIRSGCGCWRDGRRCGAGAAFDEELSCLSARDCVREILVETLDVRSIHEGANFRFGHRAEAGVDELAAFGREFGFAVNVHEAVETHGLVVSSTAVRQAVSAGDMRRARWMLGHTFAICSTPAKGAGSGRSCWCDDQPCGLFRLVPAFGCM